MTGPMSPQLDHTIAEQGEAARIILDCAQKASGFPVEGRTQIQLNADQTRGFYRRVRLRAFGGPVEHMGTTEVLSQTVNGLEEHNALELSITVEENNFTNIQGFPSGRKTADDPIESLVEAEARLKVARRHGLHAV